MRAPDRRALRWTLIASAIVGAAGLFALATNERRNDVEARTERADSTAEHAVEPPSPPQNPPSELGELERIAAVDAERNAATELETPAADVPPATSFWGRVIDSSSRAPIANASLTLFANWNAKSAAPRRTPQAPESDRRGLFEWRFTSDDEPLVWISAPGYRAVCIVADRVHTSEDRAVEIPLDRAAQVEFHVHDPSNAPLAEATVRILTSAFTPGLPGLTLTPRLGANPDWTATTDAQGIARLNEVPANVTLSVEASPRDVQQATRFPDLVLTPGEVRVCDLTLGGGSRVTGTLMAHDGRALAQRELWITNSPAVNPKQRANYIFDMHDASSTFAKTRTDELGRFEIAGVPRGRWWIGPAPASRETTTRAESNGRLVILFADPTAWTPDPLQPCALATTIDVDGVAPYELTLRVRCGLYITGRVVAPDGQPRAGSVRAHGVEVGGALGAAASSEGTFFLGPLPEARFALWADGHDGFGDSDQLVVAAGARDVELRLRAGCNFAGKLTGVDPSASDYRAFAISDVGIAYCPLREDGSFELGGMAAGKYDLVAAGTNGWFGVVRGANFRPDDRAPIEIPMHPGGRVLVRYNGPASEARVKIYDGDGLVAFDYVKQDAPCTCTVPPGHVRVEVRLDENNLQRRELDARVDEVVEVGFKFD